MYLLKMSDVCGFGDTNIWEGISDCQLKTVCLAEDGDFGARTAELTTSSAVGLSAFGQEGNIFSMCCSTDFFCRLFEG
jgi:hypothetical protein